MADKLPSKTWSCGSLLAGAAQVVDMASFPGDVVVTEHEANMMAELGHLSVEELQKVLEDSS